MTALPPPGAAGVFWLVATLVPLLVVQRRLHRELVSVLLLLTGRLSPALLIFSIVFFPGILLHEVSHWAMARLLGVRTGKVSLLPARTTDGSLRLGFVETYQTDFLRSAMVGAAPLLAGGALVGYLGFSRLGLHLVWQAVVSQEALSLAVIRPVTDSPSDLLWLYLIFVVSSMMLPSESDRRAWGPVIGFGLTVLITAAAVGAGDWLLLHIAPIADRVLSAAAVVFGLSSLVHLFLLLPIVLIRKAINRLTGKQVISS